MNATAGAIAAPPKARSEVLMIAAVIGILAVLFSPIPPWLLDLLLIANISLAMLILLLTFFTDRPLSFSTFPSVLLLATLLRLSLNVASTRLILTDAYAGDVIEAIGSYVVSGNYVIGLVVFSILIVVQFVVVTNGAQRVAEVAARFTLDAMPGKQMSIDADLNMGLITEADARTRRREIEREANFYGAMDGASKFVKGDAIASIIIVLINIIGGLSIGIAQHGMSWSEALGTYTLLTVGDGIVTQIPALVIATGTGIIVTRAATDAHLSGEIIRQIARYPRSLIMVSVVLLVALILPGIPALPTGIMLTLTLIGAAIAWRQSRRSESAGDDEAESGQAKADAGDDQLEGLLAVVPLEIEVGSALSPLVADESLVVRRLKAFRRQYALDMGLVLPVVRIQENPKRAPESYEIRFHAARVADGLVRVGKFLAINPGSVKLRLEGESTREPTFGLEAVWIASEATAGARTAGYTVVDAATVLVTHFTEVIRNHGYLLLTRREAEAMVGLVRNSQPTLAEELVPNLFSISEIQRILQELLKERVPIRNIDQVLETLAEFGPRSKESESITERVRERLGIAICQKLADKQGVLHVLTLDPAADRALREGTVAIEGRPALADPRLIERLTVALSKHADTMLASNLSPVLMCSPQLRRLVRRMIEHSLPHLSVISSSEVPSTATVKSQGVVSL